MTRARFAALLGCLMVGSLVLSPRVGRAQWTWHVTVGAQSHDMGRQALAFLPNEIWIHAGDSITFKFDADEIHTVTLMPTGHPRLPFPVGCPGMSSNPATFTGANCVTTPPMVKGQTFTVNFTSTGNFKLVCLVHENMTAAVHVLDMNAPLPHDQDFYDDQAADLRRDLLADSDNGPGKDDNDDHHGHGAHTVVAGTGEVSATAGGSSTLSTLRFIHSSIVIHAGETVEWNNEDPVTPHTITFGTEPNDPMPPVNTTTDADGAIHAVLNSPADSAHSGFIVAAPQERIGLPQLPLGTTRFRVTFKKAGTYPYICALHDDLGMKGKVVVLP